MSEHENDGFYWEPAPGDDLRQGDLLFNVPIALMPQRPRFVLGQSDAVETQTFADYPENAPSDLIVVEARFGVLGMVVTPTCHVSEEEKDENIVAVVVSTSSLASSSEKRSRASGRAATQRKALSGRCVHRSRAAPWRIWSRSPSVGTPRPAASCPKWRSPDTHAMEPQPRVDP